MVDTVGAVGVQRGGGVLGEGGCLLGLVHHCGLVGGCVSDLVAVGRGDVCALDGLDGGGTGSGLGLGLGRGISTGTGLAGPGVSGGGDPPQCRGVGLALGVDRGHGGDRTVGPAAGGAGTLLLIQRDAARNGRDGHGERGRKNGGGGSWGRDRTGDRTGNGNSRGSSRSTSGLGHPPSVLSGGLAQLVGGDNGVAGLLGVLRGAGGGGGTRGVGHDIGGLDQGGVVSGGGTGGGGGNISLSGN